jgi:acetyltransferase
MTDPTGIAEKLKPHARVPNKPVLACWMGGSSVAAGEAILNDAGIPTFKYPDTAARVFNYMAQYSYNLRGLYETPVMPDAVEGIPDREAAARLLESARSEGRTLLTEFESKRLLALYGIPTIDTRIAATEDDAIRHAEAIGFPVVLKLHSTVITHKTDVGGVQLNLRDVDAVRRAYARIAEGVNRAGQSNAFHGVTVQPMAKLDGYELIVGSSLDPQFGPVLLFGSGGMLVEVYKDRALALAPLTTTLAERMMEQTRIYKALLGVRGRPPVDMDALKKLVVRFGQLVVEQRLIKEIDINPLLASHEQMTALDARVVLHGPEVGESELPRPAIHPYPQRYMGPWVRQDGEEMRIRPIRAEDEPKMVRFHGTLSEDSVYLRYASLLKLSQRVAHERLARICFIDYERQIALVAERRDPGSDDSRIIAVARLTKVYGTNDAEFALLVSDAYQRRGIGTDMLRQLIEIGRDEGLDRITADILLQNTGMQHVCRKLGFELVRNADPDDPMMKAVKRL